MKILLKSCTIISPQSEYNGQQKDIFIDSGIISAIGDNLSNEADQVIEHDGLHVSVGWFDARVNFCDPGHEHMEDLESGVKAAELGGFTAVGLVPSTSPVISNKSQVEYVQKRSDYSSVEVHPYGTLTEGMKGENLAEMYEMQQAGAIGFTDDQEFVSAGIMYRAQLYSKNFDGKIVSFPIDYSIFGKGHVHEGKSSIYTGLKSIPAVAEYIVVQRDISLLGYTNAGLHFSGISCKESVDLIRKAKLDGMNVTADVYVHNLIFNEEHLLGFDSFFKVLPPLRSEEDRLALINGLKDGTIDFVCSDHRPQDKEQKDVEFDHAAFGAIGTQTLFSALNTIETLSLEEKIDMISKRPRAVFNKPALLKEGEQANLTFFVPNEEWTLSADDIVSKSKNSPLIGKKLKGLVKGSINKGILSLNG